MSKTKFNVKEYLGKKRIFRHVAGAVNIHKLLIWDETKQEYAAPPRGKNYQARRWEPNQKGGKKRVYDFFETLEEARAWQAHVDNQESMVNSKEACAAPVVTKPTGIIFRELVDDFRRKCYHKRAHGTCVHYDQLIRLHFGPLMDLSIYEITPKVIDEWLWNMRMSMSKSGPSKLRKSFDKELTILGAILHHYSNYNDDDLLFRFPIKSRHREDSQLYKNIGKQDRDLPPEDFIKVRAKMLEIYGPMMSSLFTIQWRQALRISEAAGLNWEDVRLNIKEPHKSTLQVARHIEWSRRKEDTTRIIDGFKNSASVGRVKAHPMFIETYEALRSDGVFVLGGKGLIFKNPSGGIWSYRQLQYRYEQAFIKAGVKYTGTHTLRHGGSRTVFNDTGGDMALAGLMLGNEDCETIKTYAKRDHRALDAYAAKKWADPKNYTLVANGGNSRE